MKRVLISTIASSPNGVGEKLSDSVALVAAAIRDREEKQAPALRYIDQLVEHAANLPTELFFERAGFRIELRRSMPFRGVITLEMGVLHSEDQWGDEESWMTPIPSYESLPALLRVAEAWAYISWCERVTEAASIMPGIEEGDHYAD